MAEIVPVVSEALEAKVRDLLPSQRGFGEDLQASNVIFPIIDLTSAAEESDTPQYLQTALAFGSQTAFSVTNTTSTVANVPGFYRVVGTATANNKSTTKTCAIQLSDGLATKNVWAFTTTAGTATDHLGPTSELFDVTVFLASGESCIISSDDARGTIAGSIRQVADVNGTLVNPSGYNPQ